MRGTLVTMAWVVASLLACSDAGSNPPNSAGDPYSGGGSSDTDGHPGDSDLSVADPGTGGGDDNSDLPAGWSCLASFYGNDDGCDCGCGAPDLDCGGASCSEPGCYVDGCQFCYGGASGGNQCPAPEGWSCGEATWDDDICDCGCGVLDYKDCYSDATCIEPGCRARECRACHDGATTSDCTPDHWSCEPAAYGNFICDCGCGAEDSDCELGNCTESGCQSPVCDVCHDGSDTLFCVAAWSCDEALWGDGVCDCGCSYTDIDCGVDSCVDEGCIAPACEVCHAGAEPFFCIEGWSCRMSFYSDGFCDCGCGVLDPECVGESCSTPGCTADACEYCWDSAGVNQCPWDSGD